MAKSKTARKRKLIRREKHKAERAAWENLKATRVDLLRQTAELESNPPEDGHQTFSPWISEERREAAECKMASLQGFEF